MAFTYSKLAEVTVGSGGAAEMDFTSIPGNYTDLIIKICGRSSRSGANIDEVYLRFNSNTGSFSNRYLQAAGSGTPTSSSGSYALWTGYVPAATATGTAFSNSEIYIPNYAGSNSKSLSVDTVQEDNITAAYITMHANLWNVSSPIINIRIYTLIGSFIQGSSATLYGVKAEV
jgi:hypothetical protein